MTVPGYAAAIAGLDRRVNLERVRDPAAAAAGYGTERMALLLERLDRPHLAAPAVHIAGTKGKGGTALLTAALLEARGHVVGRYASPHVDCLRERVTVRGEPISEKAFAEAYARVDEAARDVESDRGQAPTWFECLTALAFVAFRAADVDAAVLEVGLGGRLDATNPADLPAVVCGITPVSLDHREILGDTVGEIAGEKAGILREGADAVFGPQTPEAASVLDARAAALGIQPLRVGTDYAAQVVEVPAPDRPALPQWLDLRTPRRNIERVPLRAMGRHQADNAAMALALAERFLARAGDPPLSASAVRGAWRKTRTLPGRIEVAARAPWTVVDGAHNPASAWVLAETLRERFSAGPGERTLVFASAADKDWRVVLRILAPLAGRIVVTSFDSPRCQRPADIAAWLSEQYPSTRPRVVADPAEALSVARSSTPRKNGLVLVAGSLYLAGEARAALRRPGEPSALCRG